jgi:hypothetical protein
VNKSKVWVRPSILQDITKLNPNFRKEDKDEVKALGIRPRTALMQGYLNGPCFTGLYEDSILCMYGVVPVGEDGRIWMLSSDLVLRHKMAICRISRREVNRFKLNYRVLFNVVDERNELTMKWLKWLGFSFGATHLIGKNKQSFKEFSLWH